MRIIIFLLIISFFQSCDMDNTNQKINKIENSKAFKTSYKELYSKLNLWLNNNQYNIKILDKDSNIIHFQMDIEDSKIVKYIDFKQLNENEKIHNIVGTVDLIIKPLGNFNEVEILTNFVGILDKKNVLFRGHYFKADTVKYSSSGALEKEILDFISKK